MAVVVKKRAVKPGIKGKGLKKKMQPKKFCIDSSHPVEDGVRNASDLIVKKSDVKLGIEGKGKKKKMQPKKFCIDSSHPVEDGVRNASDLVVKKRAVKPGMKGKGQKKKMQPKKFCIDSSHPVEDGVRNASDLIVKKRVVKPGIKGKVKKKKMQPKKFCIDSSHPVEDGIMNASDFTQDLRMDYMDHRKSSLSYGPSTKKYVIRDKVIRKHDGGTDVSTKTSFRSNRNVTPLQDFNHLSPNTERNVHCYNTIRSISSRRKMVLVEDECQESSNTFEHLPQNSEASIPITDSSLSNKNKKGRMQKDIPHATIDASATGRLSEIDLIQRTTYSQDRQETEESGLQNTLPGNSFNVSNSVFNNDAQGFTHSISVDKQHKVRKISDILGKSKDSEIYDKYNADMLELLNSYYEGENSQNSEASIPITDSSLSNKNKKGRMQKDIPHATSDASATSRLSEIDLIQRTTYSHDRQETEESGLQNTLPGNSFNVSNSVFNNDAQVFTHSISVDKQHKVRKISDILGKSKDSEIYDKYNTDMLELLNSYYEGENSQVESHLHEKDKAVCMKDKNELQSSLNIHKQSINSSSRIASQVDDDCNDNDSDMSINTTEVNENKVSKTLPDNFEIFAADDEMSALVNNSETCVDKRKKSRTSTFSKSTHKKYAKSLDIPRVDDDCDNSNVLTSENKMNKNKKMPQNLLKSNRFIDNMPSVLYNKDTCTDKVPENLPENFESFAADDDKMPTLVDFGVKNKNRKSVKSSKIPKSAKKSASNYQVSKSESRIVFLVDDEEKDVIKTLYKNKKLSEIFPKNAERITDNNEISAVVNNENINKKSLISSKSIQEKDDKAANNSKGTKQCVTNIININKILAKDSILNNRSSYQIDDDDVGDGNDDHYVSTNVSKNEKVHVNLAKDFEEKSGKKRKIRNTLRKSKFNKKFHKCDIDILEMLNNSREIENSKSESFLHEKNIAAINTSKSSAAFMSSNKSPAKSNCTTVSDSQNFNAPSSSKADDGRNRPETTGTSTLGNKWLKRKSVRNYTSPKTLLLRNKDKTSLKSHKHFKSSSEIASQMDDDNDVPSDTNENSVSKTSENFKRLADDEEMYKLIDNRKTCAGKTNKKRKSVITSKSIHENVTNSASNYQKTKKCNTSAKEKDENLNLLRRSNRRRFPPLARWRGERPIYRIENGIIKFIRLDEGVEEDDYAVKCLLKRSMAKKIDKNKISHPKKIKLNDAIKKKNIPLLKRFNLTAWDPYKSNNSYRIKKSFETDNSCNGFIEIAVSKEKPLQYIPTADLYLTVMKGKIEVTVQDHQIKLELKDSIVVPRSIPYSLKNIGNVKALLVFCVGKFDYIDSSF